MATQQNLPLDDDPVRLGFFELYEYKGNDRFKRVYGQHVVFLRARDLNHAEDMVKEKYNCYWLRSGIREVSKKYVLKICEQLKRQLHFCERALGMPS
jgi:hypothetical protein